WRVYSSTTSSGPPRFVLLCEMAALAAAWSWLILQAPNANYATFKIGGWIGPGLVILAWQFARRVNPFVGKPLAAAVLGLAMLRSLGMAANVASLVLNYAGGPAPALSSQPAQDSDGRCHIVLTSTHQEVVDAA